MSRSGRIQSATVKSQREEQNDANRKRMATPEKQLDQTVFLIPIKKVRGRRTSKSAWQHASSARNARAAA